MKKLTSLRKGNIWINVFKDKNGEIAITIQKSFPGRDGSWRRTSFLRPGYGDLSALLEGLKELKGQLDNLGMEGDGASGASLSRSISELESKVLNMISYFGFVMDEELFHYGLLDVSSSYLVSSEQGLDELMLCRSYLLKERRRLLEEEILRRGEIHVEIMERIERDICHCRSLLLQRGEEFIDHYRLSLEQFVLRLEEEKRRELGSYFRDIQRLRADLREVVLEEQEESKQLEVLLS